jgi:hypothetical protein
MLVIADGPTVQERSALQLLLQKRGMCEQITFATVGKYEPQNEWIFRQESAQADMVYAKLAQGEISYGNANALIQQAYLQGMGQYTQAVQQQQAQAAQQRIQFLQLYQQQQAINAMNAPRRTSCSWVGNYLNCSSY